MENRGKIEKLEELIKGSIEGELVEQRAAPLLPPGENYCSILFKVDFKIRKEDEEKEYHAVAKCTPPNPMVQAIINTQATFKSEIAWYTTVIPTLKKFAKDYGLERDLDFFQTFYGARISLDPNSQTVDLDGVILTENLNYRGYHTIDRHIGFDAPTTFSILKDLATFHAVPLAMRIKNRELFEWNVAPFCPKLAGAMPDQMIEGFNNIFLGILNLIPELQPYMERIVKIIKYSSLFGEREVREPWVTVIHYDFWCNNIMTTGGENAKNIFIDFQVPRLGSPVGDLLLLLLSSVNFEVIKERFDEFVKFYYDEFIKNLKQLKVDTDDYTFDGLLKELVIDVQKVEFTHSLNHTNLVLAEKGVSEFDTSDSEFSFENIDKFNKGPNEKQLEKFKWIALEAVKRNWI